MKFKNILSLSASAVFACSAVCSCFPEDKPEDPTICPSPVIDVYPVAGEGHDIYTGPNYRYGPSIIINDDSSIDIWLATPGDWYGNNLILYTTDAQEPVQLGTSQTFAQKFTMSGPFGFISLQCPAWDGAEEGFTLKLYDWNGDYVSTTALTPLASKTFVNYTDNAWLSLYRSEKEDYNETFPAGTYLWVMESGTAKSGIWKCPDSSSPTGTDAVSFIRKI